jgi:hypothetical protein
VVVPFEFILNAAMPVVLPLQAGLALISAKAYDPLRSITIDDGTPFKTQFLFAVSAGGLSMAEM